MVEIHADLYAQMEWQYTAGLEAAQNALRLEIDAATLADNGVQAAQLEANYGARLGADVVAGCQA